MTPKSRFAAATLAVLCLATLTFADAPNPDLYKKGQNASRPYSMSIQSSETVTEAQLLIPAAALKPLRAELEGESPSVAGALGIGGLPPAQTAVAGVLLSLAVVFGGLWLARNGRSARARRAALVVAVCGLCALCAGAATTLTLANIAPPSRLLDAGTLPQAVSGEALTGRVKVVVVKDDTSGEIKLIVPKAR